MLSEWEIAAEDLEQKTAVLLRGGVETEVPVAQVKRGDVSDAAATKVP